MKKSEPVDLNELFWGNSLQVLDGSNRIMMPARWKVPGAPRNFHVLVIEDHLLVLPRGMFAVFLEELRRDTADKWQIPELERQLNEVVCPVSLDSVSRLPLPSEFLEVVGIRKEAKVVGRFSKFEIWPTEKFEEPNSVREATKASLRKHLLKL